MAKSTAWRRLPLQGIIALAINTCVGAGLSMIGAYGLLMGFVSVSSELSQAWGGVTVWIMDLVQGSLRPPPLALTASGVEAELTFVLTSLVPLVLLGLGAWLCRDAVLHWRGRARTVWSAERARNEQ